MMMRSQPCPPMCTTRPPATSGELDAKFTQHTVQCSTQTSSQRVLTHGMQETGASSESINLNASGVCVCVLGGACKLMCLLGAEQH